MPIERVGQQAAEQHADRPAAGHDEAEDAHGLHALGFLGEEIHDQREGDRRDDGAADPLHGPRHDKEGLRIGQAAGQRGQGEEGHTQQEQAAMAEEIAQPSAQQQKAAEGQQIGVHDPDQRGLGEAEIGPDRRQGDVHDRGIQHDHEVAEAKDDEGQPARPAVHALCHAGLLVIQKWRRRRILPDPPPPPSPIPAEASRG